MCMSNRKPDQDSLPIPDEAKPGPEPIEPARVKLTKLTWIRWFVFLIFILYLLLAHYHAFFLTSIGQYLVVDHPPQPVDLIVCLAGSNIERGLEATDMYHQGFAPRIFIAKEEPPDGYALLKERGLDYTLNVDLLKNLLEELGIPSPAILTDDTSVNSTLAEAELVRQVVQRGGCRSIMVVTSAFHTRRTYLTYKKVFGELDVLILMRYSRYSEFRPDNWWKNRRYLRSVIIEYQKLIYYWFSYLL
jgi:uncharacterized SAM-binding protein YcdF (DUF218 family)